VGCGRSCRAAEVSRYHQGSKEAHQQPNAVAWVEKQPTLTPTSTTCSFASPTTKGVLEDGGSYWGKVSKPNSTTTEATPAVFIYNYCKCRNDLCHMESDKRSPSVSRADESTLTIPPFTSPFSFLSALEPAQMWR
jgi:hypothetical protein